MKILALEFTSPQRSVAVVQGQWERPPERLGEAVETGAVNIFAMISDALQQAELEREQIECLAVGLGPGSYTGIRAAISVAQGWQLARAIKVLGLGSVECLAWQAKEAGVTGRIQVTIDAQRNEFYLAGYSLDGDQPLEVEPLRLVSQEQVREIARAGVAVIATQALPSCPEARILYPRASVLGRLALGRTDFVPAERLEPIYLRQTSFVKAPPARPIPP